MEDHSDTVEEQDYKNLISVYQSKLSDFMNQNIALEARELKYIQTIEILNKTILELQKNQKRPTKSTEKSSEDFS